MNLVKTTGCINFQGTYTCVLSLGPPFQNIPRGHLLFDFPALPEIYDQVSGELLTKECPAQRFSRAQ